MRDEQAGPREAGEAATDGRKTRTWTESECLSLPFQFAASVHIERIGSVVFPVRRIPSVKHVVGADVQEGGAAQSCTQRHTYTHAGHSSIMKQGFHFARDL